MLGDGLGQVEENGFVRQLNIGTAGESAVNVQHARSVMRAHALPEFVEFGAGRQTGVWCRRRRERIELEAADIGPAPLFVARTGPGKRLKPRECLAAALHEPRGLVALRRNASKLDPVKPPAPAVVVSTPLLIAVIPLFHYDAAHGLVAGRHPTDPSIWSWISLFISTAYSMGSSLTSGSMKPLTIRVEASASERPRLIR